MTTTTHPAAGTDPRPPAAVEWAAVESARRRTARTTGLLYLLLAVTGVVGFLVVRPLILVPDDPAATMANLLARETLAGTGIVLELGIVASQALVALWESSGWWATCCCAVSAAPPCRRQLSAEEPAVRRAGDGPTFGERGSRRGGLSLGRVRSGRHAGGIAPGSGPAPSSARLGGVGRWARVA